VVACPLRSLSIVIPELARRGSVRATPVRRHHARAGRAGEVEWRTVD
jgi:hypothetical protein